MWNSDKWQYMFAFVVVTLPTVSVAEQQTEQPSEQLSEQQTGKQSEKQSEKKIDTVSKKRPVKVFNNTWSRLFSGSDDAFSSALTYSSGLTKTHLSIPTGKDTTEKKYRVDQKLLFSMQYTPFSYFFANVTLRTPIQDINRYSNDFVYSFGYDDWHPGTFSLVYSNYSDNNHFYPQRGKQRTIFEQGTITAAYKFGLPENIEEHLLINQNDSLSCQVGYSYSPRYFNSETSTIKNNKSKLLGSCGYTLKEHYFLRVSAFYYPDNKQRQPWDGDYSYSIGYVSSYEPGAISIHYNNYAATRYPGRSSSSAKARYGTINFSWTLPW